MKLCLFVTFIILLSLTSCKKDEVTNVILNNSKITIKVGDKDTILANLSYNGDINKFPITWTSSSTNTVQVNNGVINAVSEGTATITAQAGGKTAICLVTVTKRDINLVLTKATASFWGDFFKVGTNNLTIYFLENSLSFDASGNINGTGNYLYIDFNVAALDSTLSKGTYSIANTRAASTFIPGDTIHYNNSIYIVGTHVMNIGTTKNTAHTIKDGYYNIIKNGDNFKIEGQLISSTDEVIQFSYNGPVEFINQIKPIYPALSQADLYYWGDIYKSSTTNNFTVILGDKSINMDSLSGNGDMMMLELNAPLAVTNYIPDGTYEMMTDLQIEYLLPETLVPGYSSSSGNKWGTWYLGKSSDALTTGNASFIKSGNNYTINYKLYNDIKTKVSGTFTGNIRYFNYSNTASGISAAKIKQKINANNNKMNKIRRIKLIPLYHE